MKLTKAFLLLLLIILATGAELTAQCETWVGSAEKDHLEEQHSVYRGFIKNKNYEGAYESWNEVYTKAPAADGLRGFHYTDGIEIYKSRFAAETDAAKKEEHAEMVIKLYDEAIVCYQNRSIKIKGDKDEDYANKISDLYSRQSYEMYYQFLTPYSRTMESLAYAFEIGGLNAPYTIIVPYANITVHQFLKEQIDKETARLAHDEMLKLADYNISNGHQYAEYYQQAKDNMLAEFKKIQYQIFDCEYFKDEWIGDYEDNKDDPAYAKDLYNKLKARGCDDADPLLIELKGKWEKYATELNAARQQEFEANNPRMMAKKCYDAGDWDCAIGKYREAIAKETDPTAKAKYHFSIASILFRKMNKYSEARKEALDAAAADPNWGRPYALIGDIYAKAARGCGDSWNQSLAILAAHQKWAFAKSKTLSDRNQSDVAGKLSKYRAYFPSKDDGFMRGAKPGSKVSVGCWIGEAVTVQYK